MVKTIEKGKTTRADVERMFGAPYSVALLADGKTMLMYFYTQSKGKTANYIPGGALVAGGADTYMEQLQVIVINDSGIVADYTYSASNNELKTGVMNQ